MIFQIVLKEKFMKEKENIDIEKKSELSLFFEILTKRKMAVIFSVSALMPLIFFIPVFIFYPGKSIC